MNLYARGWLTSQTDANGNQTDITYDGTGRIIRVTNPDDTFATYDYAYGTYYNTVTYTNECGDPMEYRYDLFGHLTEVYDPASGKAVTTNTYDSLGRLVLEVAHTISGADRKTYHWYDAQNRLIETGIRNADGTNTKLESYEYADRLGKTTHTVYGETGAPTTVTTVYKDNMGNTVKTGRLLDGTESTDTYANDYLGNCTQVTSAYTASLGGAFTQRTAYDFQGHPLRVTDAANQTVIYGYDWQGNQTSTTDAKGTTATNTYDALGRQVLTSQPFEGTSSSITKFSYDGAGNLIGKTVSNSLPSATEMTFSSTEYTYNNRSRLVRVDSHPEDAAANYTQYEYDAVGNPLRMYTGLTSPLTITGLDQVSGGSEGYHTTKYTYDRFGNQLSNTDELNQTESSTYDLTGDRLTRTDRNGGVTTYTYDNRGRLIRGAVVTASGEGNVTSTYTYALNGKKLSESSGDGTTQFTYDALGRTLTETKGGTVKSYAYNIGDLRTAFTLTLDGVQQMDNSYSYDALGRLSQVSGSGVTANYAYDPNGNRSTVIYNNGVQETYAYNKANLVTQVANKKGVMVLSQYDYAYDLSGRQVSKSDQTGTTTAYDYNGLGQLTGEQQTQGGMALYRYSYAYDSSGNRSLLQSTAGIPQPISTTGITVCSGRKRPGRESQTGQVISMMPTATPFQPFRPFSATRPPNRPGLRSRPPLTGRP